MNKTIVGLVALTAAVALAAWLFLAAGERKPVAVPEPASAATAAQQAPEGSLQEPFREPSQAGIAELANSDSGTGADSDIEALRKLNCSAEKHMVHLGDGLVTEAYSCEPPQTDGPFAAYSDADLLVLSYSDADAAEELGKRLLFQNEQGPANEMMLRAVALRPDDISPLQFLVSQTGSLRGPSREARTQVANAYIISKTASYFDPTVTTGWLRKDLAEHRFSAEDIERLDRLVEGNLARMRAVQIEVFGESRIGEAL